MNEVSTYREQLPDTLEDLTQFVLVGRSKLNAYKIKLQTVNRLSDAQNIREQTLQDMQDVSIAIVAAEQRIGEILLSIEKRSGRPPENNSSGQPEKLPTKQEVASDMGYSRNQVSEYQRMAQNPDVVKAVIDEAVKNGEMVTRTQVMKDIRAIKADMKAEMAEKDRRIAELQNREPEVREVVKEVVKEVVPNDYEDWKTGYQKMVKERQKAVDEMLEAKRELREIRNASPEQEVVNNAKEQMDYFSIATYNYLKKYGGFTWAFNKWEDVPEETKKNFADAINALAGFSQQMLKNLEVINERTEQSVND